MRTFSVVNDVLTCSVYLGNLVTFHGRNVSLGSSPSEAAFLLSLPYYVGGCLIVPKLLRVNDF